MPRDFYKLLGVDRSCTDEELKKAYRKQSLIYHPDRQAAHPSGLSQKASESRFKEISEAYQTLSNKDTRRVYDLYGEEGLKRGGGDAPPPSGGGGGGGFGGVPSGAGGGFAGGGPFGGMPGGSGGGMDPGAFFAAFMGGDFGGHADESWSGGVPVTGRRAAKPAAQRLELPLSLEELYHGCTKHVRLTRRRRDAITGQIVESARVLEIAILPGMKAGSSFTYEGEGDQLAAGRPPQDIAIVLSEKPHTRFRREGADLHASVLLPLVDALTAERISMQTLDGRNIDVPLEGVVSPGSRAVVRGEGMPQRSSPLRGNLIITFDVRFPTTKLTGESARAVRAALSGKR